MGIDDEAVVSLARLFNEPAGGGEVDAGGVVGLQLVMVGRGEACLPLHRARGAASGR